MYLYNKLCIFIGICYDFNLYKLEEIRLTEAIAINRAIKYINYYLLCFSNTH